MEVEMWKLLFGHFLAAFCFHNFHCQSSEVFAQLKFYFGGAFRVKLAMYEYDVEILKASRTHKARNECVICQQLSGVFSRVWYKPFPAFFICKKEMFCTRLKLPTFQSNT